MRIATWNVNSVRTRAERIVAFLDRQQVDVLAMQETKAADAKFPYQAFHDAGYEVAHVGYNQWNGVAIAVARRRRKAVTAGAEHASGDAQ